MTEKPIAWVEVVPQDQACGVLAAAYDRVKDADGVVENLYLAMSQTPLAMGAADDHYRATLHNPDNPLPLWLCELLSTYVAILGGCDYAATNHGANFQMYLNDPVRGDALLSALREEDLSGLDDPQLLAALRFTHKLTTEPDRMCAADISALRDAGFCDKAISYQVQLVAGFAYWVRVINALGIRVGDRIGLSQIPADA